MAKDDAIINPRGNKLDNVPKAEPRSFLPRGKNVSRGSVLGFDGEISHEVLINELAEMIVEAYFHYKNNEK
jgi:hypothetical protein